MASMNTITMLVAGLLAMPAFSQGTQPTSPAFERALVLEELEGDAQAAAAAYEAIGADAKAPHELRGRAWYRAGRLLGVAGDEEAARAALEHALAFEGTHVERARALLQDPAGEKDRERQVRERVRALLRDVNELPPAVRQPLVSLADYPVGKDLLWIGAPAVPEIVRAIRTAWRERDRWVARELTGLVWQIGGPDAVQFVSSVRDDEDVEFRRTLVAKVAAARGADMIAEAEAFLGDSDPEGQVAIRVLALELVPRYEVQSLLRVLDHQIPGVRETALRAFSKSWPGLRHEPDVAATARLVVPKLARDVSAVDPGVSRAATELLLQMGLKTREGRKQLIRVIPRLAGNLPSPGFRAGDEPVGFDGADDEAKEIGAMLRELGRVTDAMTPRQKWARFLVGWYLTAWRREALPTVLEAIQLGYTGDEAMRWLSEKALADDAEETCRALSARSALDQVARWLAELDRVPAACWQHLRGQLASSDNERERLYIAMGKTGHPEVPDYLLARFEAQPDLDHYGEVHAALLWYSEVEPQSATAALRQLLGWSLGESQDRLTNMHRWRNQIVARLIQIGDPEVIPMLSAARGLGLRSCYPFKTPSYAAYGNTGSRDELEWLVDLERDKVVDVWHGYDPKTYASVVAQLLAPDDAGQYGPFWKYVGRIHWQRAPGALLAATRAWRDRIASGVDQGDLDDGEAKGLRSVRHAWVSEVTEDPETMQELRALVAACLESPSWHIRDIGVSTFWGIERELDAEERAWVIGALDDPEGTVVATARGIVRYSNIPIGREVVQAGLQSTSEYGRQSTIEGLAPFATEDVTDLVRKGLFDPSLHVRIAACEFLGTRADVDSVADLLGMLSDPAEEVRAAASTALTAIRFYHDEKAHWDRVFSGEARLTENSAAEALLAQADPGNDKATRLLAIRSLGQLGVPEALPFLIEWAKSADAEIATEARSAVARIHADDK